MEGSEVRLRVIQYFLRNSPVGELKEVLNDLKGIVGDQELLEQETIQDTLIECLAAHGATVSIGESQAMLTPQGRTGSSFIDPKIAKRFIFNSHTFEAESVEEIEPQNSRAQAIQTKLDQYLSQHYSETAQARVFTNEDGFSIFLASPVLNLRNMWTGEWLSNWKVVGNKIEGEINIRAHYFEEGNLQSNQKKECSKNINEGDDEAFAQAVSRAIFEFEDQVHRGMHALYEQIPQACFKSMRRALPVTQTKFSEIHKTKMLS
ncbi:unnamed protein product [Blepharisma stoltei]|uniref:F-actin-capping protein subunit alpha n=1 Tax=Blepharisma stoltei TaxID=1481888 RepID=A0AAU9JUR9_9CILI|nr:unnamed protein product [Blepharisma stoltei]